MNRNWGQEHRKFEAGHKAKLRELEMRGNRGWRKYPSSSPQAWRTCRDEKRAEDQQRCAILGPGKAWWCLVFCSISAKIGNKTKQNPVLTEFAGEFLEVPDPNERLLTKISMIANGLIILLVSEALKLISVSFSKHLYLGIIYMP